MEESLIFIELARNKRPANGEAWVLIVARIMQI